YRSRHGSHTGTRLATRSCAHLPPASSLPHRPPDEVPWPQISPDRATAPSPAPQAQARGSNGKSSPAATYRRIRCRPSETGAGRASPPTTPASPAESAPGLPPADFSRSLPRHLAAPIRTRIHKPFGPDGSIAEAHGILTSERHARPVSNFGPLSFLGRKFE